MNKLTEKLYVEELNDVRAVPGTLTVRKWQGMTHEYLNLLEGIVVECLMHQMPVGPAEQNPEYWEKDPNSRYFSTRLNRFMSRSYKILKTHKKHKPQFDFET